MPINRITKKDKDTLFDPLTGQTIHVSHRGNSPPRYSEPSFEYKQALKRCADKNCVACQGTGYRGKFRYLEGGRCFKCIPDTRWNNLLANANNDITKVDAEPEISTEELFKVLGIDLKK